VDLGVSDKQDFPLLPDFAASVRAAFRRLILRGAPANDNPRRRGIFETNQ
jgi:hypothetical protein